MATDLSVSMEDRPGALAALGEALGNAGVNISGLAALGGHGGGHVHRLVEDSETGRSALEAAGITVEATREAVVVDAGSEDRPGKLGELAGKAGDAGINLVACYVATGSRLVLVADDADALRGALGR
ncbi:MAG TPA: ACT domain-containing protein [Actinomycetota bacterium]|nr:ACT domain-containing protein [Actinomycetota bacterium]